MVLVLQPLFIRFPLVANNVPKRALMPLYAEAVLKFAKLDTQAQQRGAVVQGRSLLPYRLRYILDNDEFLSKKVERKIMA
jgi:hypothetical protein